VETDEEEFVLRIGRLEELDSGLLSLAEFVSHAAAVIEDDSDGDRNVFGREVHDLLLDVVFKDSEIISQRRQRRAGGRRCLQRLGNYQSASRPVTSLL